MAMIQKEAVGVGICGQEGLQAGNSADFAMAQFRFLSRLLFVHGAWNYSSISKVILSSFYKNITLFIIELLFAIYNYWNGQVIYERWTIEMYNMIFTSTESLLTDVAFRAVKTTVFTTETDRIRIRIAEVMHKEVAAYVEGGTRPLTESLLADVWGDG